MRHVGHDPHHSHNDEPHPCLGQLVAHSDEHDCILSGEMYLKVVIVQYKLIVSQDMIMLYGALNCKCMLT